MTYDEFKKCYEELRKELKESNSDWDWDEIEDKMITLENKYSGYYEQYLKENDKKDK